MRRFTRRTNGFSKTVASHEHMLAIYFLYYNFRRVHQTLRVTPAVEAGLVNHVWTLEEMAGLIQDETSNVARIDQLILRRVLGEVA